MGDGDDCSIFEVYGGDSVNREFQESFEKEWKDLPVVGRQLECYSRSTRTGGMLSYHAKRGSHEVKR